MFDVLSSVLPYDRLNSREYDSRFSAGLRKEIVGALREMVTLEKRARVIVQEILNDWR